MNNYEKRQGYSSRVPKPDADRDGKNFEKRDFKTIFKRQHDGKSTFKSEQYPNRAQQSEHPIPFKKNHPGEKKSYSISREYDGENRNFKPRGEFRPNSDFKPRGERTFTPYGKSDRPTFNRYNSRDENGSGNRYFNKEKKYSDNRLQFKKRDENYNPNSKYTHKKQTEYRKVHVDPNKPVRLNKFLANAGICSRREADEYIQAGVVSVNGEVVSALGVKIMPADSVMFHNQPVRSERKVYLLLNKPKDCITTVEDTHERTTVLDIVKNACSERIYPVGRLDRNTTGVILLTNDGDLAMRLTHPKYDKKKIYHIVLDRPIEPVDFEKVTSGIQLDDETFIAADALEYIKDDDKKQLGIEIHSGQNRIVRRIFDKLGYRTVRLDRVFFAGLTKKNLPRGKYRFLSEREVNMLKMGAYE